MRLGAVDQLPADPRAAEINAFEYAYDPRVTWLEDRYYITWCNGYHGPTIGMAWTKDFVTFTQMENSFLPYNRNGVPFPQLCARLIALAVERFEAERSVAF